MTLPAPEPGLVIRYSYLWAREHDAGRGIKDRPCAIVFAIVEEDGNTRVTVLPVTHSSPDDPAEAIEIPFETKKRLGLDSARSWIMLTEGNEFLWPGPDLRPLPGADLATVVYGALPPRFFNIVHERFAALVRARRSARVKRTE